MAKFDERFPVSRTWFETQDGNRLVQVQRDRFLHNWKKEKDSDKYPHYEYVIKNFETCFEIFEAFLHDHGLGNVEPRQYELTYINHIFKGEGWDTLNDVGNIFQDFFRRKNGTRFLPEPEIIQWFTSFTLPNRTGRLHVSVRLGARKSDGRPTILLELTARGMSADQSRESMWSWFKTAHEWIVQGFSDVTTNEIQAKLWRRKQ